MSKIINVKSVENKLILLWIASVFFDSYAIIYISTYPVTLFTIMSVIIVLISCANIYTRRTMRIDTTQKIDFIMVLYVILSYLLTGMKNASSLMLTEFFFVMFILVTRDETRDVFESHIHLFSIFMNILAVYGIYQFWGRYLGLPFCDLIIEGHMVSGFNWSNRIRILGIAFYRSNAIFREPSFYSQYLAINTLIHFSRFLRGERGKNIFVIAINGIAMILTFSGTGIIILLFGGLIYIFKVKKDYGVRKRILLVCAAIIIVSGVFLNSSVGAYFIGRVSEILVYSESAFSGYVRFRSGLDVLKEAWKSNLILGIGIGTSTEFIEGLSNYYKGMTVNGFYRPAVEIGLIGVTIWILFLSKIFNREERLNDALVLQCVLLPFLICHETFQSNYYWIILYILNFRYLKGVSDAEIQN